MRYSPLPLSERIKKLREEYLALPVPTETNPYAERKFKCFGTGDRWISLGYLRGWKKHENAPTTRLRASLSEAEELYAAEPVILDGELLLGHLYFPDYSKEELAEYDALYDAFQMSPFARRRGTARKCHIALDYGKLIRVGINGLRREIKEKLSQADPTRDLLYADRGELGREEFYNCLLLELDAVSDLAKRYAQTARKRAAESPEPRRSELLKMAEIISRVPDEPAESFYEAIQSVHFYLSTLFGLYPLARPDRYLYDLYKKDIESGKITREFAMELVDNFCLGITDRVFSRAACGFIVGGSDGKGGVVENDLTYMFITALEHLQLPDPNGALAVCDATSDELVEYCAEVLYKGTTHPAFYNDEAIVNSLNKNYGVSPADAVEYIQATCAEMSIAGKSKSHSTPYMLDLPSILLNIANKCCHIPTFDALFEEYIKEIRSKTISGCKSYLLRILEAGRNGNDSLRAYALVDDCIERGLSVYEGGARYTFIQPIFVGFANAVDSLVAIRQLVFKERRLTLEEYCNIVRNDFEGHDQLLAYILNKLPHYGNDSRETDEFAGRLAAAVDGIIRDNKMPLSKHMSPGTFTYINHANLGAACGATFDGRRAHTAYADGCCPAQGMDKSGPTALINSLTSWDQSDFLGGMVVNVKLRKSDLVGEKKSLLPAMLRCFIRRGGIEMQVNAVDRETLIDARDHPERHGDLLVRIGGFSDYFVKLTPTLQNELIDRTEY